MAEQATTKTNITYVPPAPEVLEQVARSVCRKLADSDPLFNEPDVVYGFASFLSAVAKMHANHLTKLAKSTDIASLDTDT
jgi:effector-binding domain-containing protein